jgi:hypothetical protein
MATGPVIELRERGHVLATWQNVMIQIYAAEARRTTVLRATEIMRRLNREHPAGIGSIVLVSHVGPPPDQGCRTAWTAQMRDLGAPVTLILFEGASLRASIVRGVVTGMALLVRRTVNMRVAASPAEGLPWFTAEMDRAHVPCGSVAELTAALEQARAEVKAAR